MIDQMFAPLPRTADLLPEEVALVSATANG
jgi:hypothetical protein